MKMKYTEQAVETLDDAGSVIANKNIEIDELKSALREALPIVKDWVHDNAGAGHGVIATINAALGEEK